MNKFIELSKSGLLDIISGGCACTCFSEFTINDYGYGRRLNAAIDVNSPEECRSYCLSDYDTLEAKCW